MLLGYRSPSEISKTIAQRAAHLVVEGEDRLDVFRALRKVYGVRSKLVHEGKEADAASVVLLQQFLMAALPAVAAAHPIEKHDVLVAALDEANFREPEVLRAVQAAQWARYVPIASLCRSYLAEGGK